MQHHLYKYIHTYINILHTSKKGLSWKWLVPGAIFTLQYSQHQYCWMKMASSGWKWKKKRKKKKKLSPFFFCSGRVLCWNEKMLKRAWYCTELSKTRGDAAHGSLKLACCPSLHRPHDQHWLNKCTKKLVWEHEIIQSAAELHKTCCFSKVCRSHFATFC